MTLAVAAFGVWVVERPVELILHVRTALTQTHLSIPLLNGEIALGQWQGIFLYEHRHIPASRRILLHLIGD